MSIGVDPTDLDLRSFCNIIEFWATQNMDEKQRGKFESQLWMPTSGEEALAGPWSAEAELSAFDSAASSR